MSNSRIGQKLAAQSILTSLPPRKSSDQSTLDMHKQIALQDSSNTVETIMRNHIEGGGLPRALSAERDLHLPPRAPLSTPSGKTPEGGTPSAGQQLIQRASASSQVNNLECSRTFWT